MRILWILAAACAAYPQTCPQGPKVFFHCVEPIAGSQNQHAVFGYEYNVNAQTGVTISAGGPCNFLLPTNFRTGLIGRFEPGLHERAFRVEVLPSEPAMLWILGNELVLADLKSAPRCQVDPPPALPPALVGVPYSQKLSTRGLAQPVFSEVLTQQNQSLLPAGIALAADGTLSGIPATAGRSVFKVQATDGSTTATADYALTVSNGLAFDDGVSTRAPGFTPQYRVVTNPSSAITSTAACAANEVLITGGGACTVPNSNTVLGRIASSQPSGNGWTVTCSGGTATATAVCQR